MRFGYSHDVHRSGSDPVQRQAADLTAEEARALQLAAELRERIARERETAQMLSTYLKIRNVHVLPDKADEEVL